MDEAKRKRFVDTIRKAGAKDWEIITGTIKSVDEKAMTCTVEVLSTDEPITGVTLNVLEDNTDGIYLIPETGADCIICSADGPGEYHLVFATKVKKWSINAGGSTLVADKNGWVLNGGNNGGVPITSKVVDRLNKLEQDVNSLKQVLTSWTPVANDGGAALKTAAATWYAQQLVETQDADIKNDKLKH